MPELQADPLSSRMSNAEVLDVTVAVAAVVREAHGVAADPADAHPTLVDGVLRHLEIAKNTLIRHGYQLSDVVIERCKDLYTAGPATVLHGDLAPNNVVRDPIDGQLWLLDPCGYLGPAEFDAARWCARFERPELAVTALHAWMAIETLDVARATELLGAELVMQAGVRELVKDEQGGAYSLLHDECTAALLEAGKRHLKI